MSKKFTTYKELLDEKQKLELLLAAQKQTIHADIEELKAQLRPVTDAFQTVRKFFTRDKTSAFLDFGSDLVITGVVKNLILARMGWVTKLVVPYFLKNFSSHFVADQKDKWIEKLKQWIGHKNGKHHSEKEKESKSPE